MTCQMMATSKEFSPSSAIKFRSGNDFNAHTCPWFLFSFEQLNVGNHGYCAKTPGPKSDDWFKFIGLVYRNTYRKLCHGLLVYHEKGQSVYVDVCFILFWDKKNSYVVPC